MRMFLRRACVDIIYGVSLLELRLSLQHLHGKCEKPIETKEDGVHSEACRIL